MLKRIPILPTLIVLIAVGIMIRLGVWQLDRMYQKEALLAQYEHALTNTSITDLGADMVVDGPFDYSHVRLLCMTPTARSMQAGHNSHGETGWAHLAICPYQSKLKGKSETEVVIGWSKTPNEVDWSGGALLGTVVPGKVGKALPNNGGIQGILRIVADPPLAGLQPNARPDPKDLPNNHWSYAIQWFLFSLTALVIYGLALRKRLAALGADR